jgi:predicted Rossmann fold nucleotide-binding protein DprA/Smf involved in DNA uptake
MVMPNYDKRMKSDREIQLNQISNYLPTTAEVLARRLKVPTVQMYRALARMEVEGTVERIKDGNQAVWRKAVS